MKCYKSCCLEDIQQNQMACIKLRFISKRGYFTYSSVNFVKFFKNDNDEPPDIMSPNLLPACMENTCQQIMISNVNLWSNLLNTYTSISKLEKGLAQMPMNVETNTYRVVKDVKLEKLEGIGPSKGFPCSLLRHH